MVKNEWEEVAHLLISKPLPEWVAVFLASGLEENQLRTLCQGAPRLRDPRIFPKVLSVALNYAEMREPNDAERRTELFLRLLGGYTFKGKLVSLVRFARLDFSGHSFDSADIRDGQFLECTLRGASFRSSNLTNVVFEACDLSGVDFSSARANNVSFADCDVERASMVSCVGLSVSERQWLSNNGALVDMTGIATRRVIGRRDTVKELLQKVVGKFRYDASKMESALVRGIPLGQRHFVSENVIKRLENAGYLTVIDRGKATPRIYKRNDKKNPEMWQFVDSGEESEEIRSLIDALARE